MDKVVKKSMIKTIRGCIKHGDFVLRSGKKSKYFIEMRSLISQPEEMNTLVDMIWSRLPKEDYDLIVGLPYAGIPYACFLSSRKNVPMILLRNEVKKHGTANMVEGDFKKGDRLVIIDDVLTTGSSVIDSLPFFKDFKIVKVIVVIDREQGGREELERRGLKVESLFKISDLIDQDHLAHI